MDENEKITYIGNIDFRNKEVKFGIKNKDRTRHTYIIGKTGMGKSTLLENLAIQDIQNGYGLCFIDPHGDVAEKLLDYVPIERIQDVIYFSPADTEYPMAFNILESVDESKRHLVANGLMAAFKKIFGEDKFSDRMQYILNNIILSLLENKDETLLGVNRILNDKNYRKKILDNVKDPSVRAFWLEEYAKAGEKYQQEAAPAIQNKIGQFTSNPLIRNIIGQKRTAFDIRKIMDEKKILIINLSKGKVGEGNANLIGSLIVTKIYLAAMSRADAGPYNLKKLAPFYLYVDEFQNFANDSFANILSEARKYQLSLTVANQYLDQMSDEVKSAVFGNVGTMIVFRVGAEDAEVFEKEFAPNFTADDIVNLAARQIYLRLMIDGQGSKPFSARTLPPISKPEESFAQSIIDFNRIKYAKKKLEVVEQVENWYKSEKENNLSGANLDQVKKNDQVSDLPLNNLIQEDKDKRKIEKKHQEFKKVNKDKIKSAQDNFIYDNTQNNALKKALLEAFSQKETQEKNKLEQDKKQEKSNEDKRDVFISQNMNDKINNEVSEEILKKLIDE